MGMRGDESAADAAKAIRTISHAGASKLGPTGGQWVGMVMIAGLAVAAVALAPRSAVQGAIVGLWWLFLALSAWRVWTVFIVSRFRPRAAPQADLWPRYTIVAALRHEAGMMDQLISRLARIDYPADRLEGFLVIEADDPATLAAAKAATRPAWLRILIAPPGLPRTKPRALNIALAQATGALLTIYDAEDDPHPLQLREAAGRFSRADSRLACLQAPLRIRGRTARSGRASFIERQFAAEYAALFEVLVPAMAALRLPFPLGGTSNHFRVDILRRVGGWDPCNVTEDADLGFRLASAGWRLGVLDHPTYETPPDRLEHWLPQRTRWIKGYMQTWGVHMRAPWRLGWRGFLSLQLTLGVAILSAMVHALSLAWVATLLLVAITGGLTPDASGPALTTLLAGVTTAWLSCAVGARRAGIRYGLIDMATAPAYWAMQSAAFAHAFWRLVRAPHAWDKTPHTPEPVETAGRQAA